MSDAPGEKRGGVCARAQAETGALASVVVATLGRAPRLGAFVDAVLADPGTLELVMVVDGPDEESRTLLRDLATTRPRLRVLPVPHVGQLAALDAGVWAAAGDVVVLLDDDVVPAPGTIAGHARRHAERGTVVVGPMPVAASGRRAPFGTRLYATEYLAHIEAIARGDLGVLDALWTGNLSMRKDDCLAVGLFNPTFETHYHADRDLGYRLARAGVRGVFDPALVATHLHWRSDRQFLCDARGQGAGRVMLSDAYTERLGPFRLTQVVEDLPAGLRALVGAVGSSGLAEPIALGILAAGRVWERLVPGLGSPIVTAKLARRIMQWHGAQDRLSARAAKGEPSGARAASETLWSPRADQRNAWG